MTYHCEIGGAHGDLLSPKDIDNLVNTIVQPFVTWKWEPTTELELPTISRVIFNNPATIVFWDDGTKTVVKCQPGDTFSEETGLMAAMLKRFMGNNNTYNKVINRWICKTNSEPKNNE